MISWKSITDYLRDDLLPAVLLLVVGVLVIRLVMRIVKKLLEKSKLAPMAHTLIRTLLRVVLYGLLILMVASNLGIDVTGVVALASVLTLAISLSVQDALTNLISGFTLLHTKPFDSGDFVEVSGQSGVVQEIGLTYTKLQSADNKVIFIPNSAVTTAQIVNYTTLGTRRAEIQISTSCAVPVERTLAALLQAAQVPTALEDPVPAAVVQGYDQNAIRFSLYVWSKAEDYWSTLCTVKERLQAVLAENSVELAYPHVHLHTDK